MESSTPPNTTTTAATTTTTTTCVPEQIFANVTSPTISHSNPAFTIPRTTSRSSPKPKPFSIPTEKKKEKSLAPTALSFPIPPNFFGDTGGIPFKFPIFNLPRAFPGTKASSSTNLFDRQNPVLSSSIFSKFSSDKSNQPGPVFSKNINDPKVDKETKPKDIESTSSTPKAFSFQAEIVKPKPAFSSSSNLSTENLFSTKSSPQVFGKNLEKNEHSMLFKKTENEQQMTDDKDSRGNQDSRVIANPDESLPSTSTGIRHQVASQMDVKHLTAIICKGLHPEDNKKDILLRHFLKFGNVTKITCNLNQKHAIVQFTDHESAAKAKKNGPLISTIHNPVSIFWCQKGPSRNVRDTGGAHTEVDDELRAMLEGAGEHDLLVRPREERTVPRAAKQKTSKNPSKPVRASTSKSPLAAKPSTSKSPLAAKPSTSKQQVKSTVSPAASISVVVPEEIWTKALTQIAHTPADKFFVLDSRDKLIRQSLEKQSDFKTKVICGTCPDMCPEKERYGRFTKSLLSLYEQSPDPLKLEHQIAIKEYSRSSADQEEPLPHELRPPETLALTMNYLLCNIMDKTNITESDTAIGDWYDFIWNRIRAIQKDIIQQDLCNATCVEIVEKCVRFHIHCSATLCDKELSVFDPKINHENLLKSLKTLKNFYADLAANEIICPDEPEFRAYDILLHLNEGNNTLRYVQNLRMEVRNSPEVRFAVSAAFAFTNHNYVRFFKLLSQSTYFNACILHRYFAEVRMQALKIILKAYCRPNKIEQYPVKDLCDLLKFENYVEAVQFCEKLGLQTVENYVVLDRLAFVASMNSFYASQAPIVVGSKKQTSLGEAINHKPLPENPLCHYTPHNSFDEKGYLKKKAYQGLDQFIAPKLSAASSRNTSKLDTCSTPSSTSQTVMALPQPPTFSLSLPYSKSFKSRYNQFNISTEKPKLPVSPLLQPSIQPFVQPIIIQEKEKITKDGDAHFSGNFPSVSYNIQHKPEHEKITKDGDAHFSGNFPSVSYNIQNKPEHEKIKHGAAHFSGNFPSVSYNIQHKPEHEKITKDGDAHFSGNFPSVSYNIQHKPEHEKITKEGDAHFSGNSPSVSYNIQHKPEHSKQVTQVSIKESDVSLTQHSEETFQSLFNSIFNNVTYDMIRHVSTSAYTEDLQLQEKMNERLTERLSTSTLQDLISAVVEEELIDIVRQDVAFYQKKKLNVVSSIAFEVLLEKCLESFIEQIVKEIYETQKERWLTELENARMKVVLSRVRKAFWRWHKATIRKQQMETCRNTFPCCPTLQFKVRSPTRHLLSTPVEASAVQNINARLLESGVLCKAIKEELSWMPLDLTAIFENAFNSEIEFPLLSPTMNYWKVLLVYFEDADIGPDFTLISQWVCAKFSKGCEKVKPYAESKVCSLYWLTDLSKHRIAVCVRSIAINSKTFQKNLAELKNAALLDGTVAVLVCLPSKAASNFSKDYHQELEWLLEAKANVPSVPLYSLIIGPNPSFSDIARNSFIGFQKKKLISDFEICTLDLKEDFYQLSEKVSAAMDWLVHQCPKMPHFTTKYFKDYLQDGIVEVFNIVFQDISHKKNNNEFYQDPNAIIALFNESIKHRCFLVTSPSLNSISGPPPELVEFGKHSLSWKNSEFRYHLRSIMEGHILPQFNGYPLFCEDAMAYGEIVVASVNKSACNLISSINNLLCKSMQIGEKEFLIPWSDVIYECVQFLYSNQIYSEPIDEIFIVYLQEELESFNLARRWKEISESASVLEFCDNYLVVNDGAKSSTCKRKLDNDCESSFNPDTSPLSEKRKKMNELEISLKAEKENSDAFSVMLQQAMNPHENLGILLPPNPSECYDDNFDSGEPAITDSISTERHEFSCSGDIVQQVLELEQSIESEKNATIAFNSTLQALLL